MTPRGLSPLSYGRLVDCAGRARHDRQGRLFVARALEKAAGSIAGMIWAWALSRNRYSFKHPKPRKPAETLLNPPIPPATLLLLYYSCTTATPAAHAALVTKLIKIVIILIINHEAHQNHRHRHHHHEAHQNRHHPHHRHHQQLIKINMIVIIIDIFIKQNLQVR